MRPAHVSCAVTREKVARRVRRVVVRNFIVVDFSFEGRTFVS